MADRAAIRLAVDLGFAAALVATGIATYVLSRPPAVPAGVCKRDDGAPRYAELYADASLTIAVVIGELEGGPTDHNASSYRAVERALRERGFLETAPAHFELYDTAVDLQLWPDDRVRLGTALTTALVDHDVVYFTGHNQGGGLAIRAPDVYRVIVMDTCFATQLYSARLVDEKRDVISNRERSITGSVESLLVVLDGLRARAGWRTILGDLDDRAEVRARMRTGLSQFRHAEDYRLDTQCPH